MVLLYCLTEKWQREKQLLDKELNLQTLEETVSYSVIGSYLRQWYLDWELKFSSRPISAVQ